MRAGHIISLVGGGVVAFGGVALEWQTFELAGVTARGFEVSLAGQAVVVLATLIAAASAVGLTTRFRYQAAGVTLVSALALFGWLVYAHVGALGAFEAMAFERVEMLSGYTTAVWGAALALLGPLVVVASNPAAGGRGARLRVALLWEDTVVGEQVLREGQSLTLGDIQRRGLAVPEALAGSRAPLFRGVRGGAYSLALSPAMSGQITVDERTQPVAAWVDGEGGAAVPLSVGDWGMLDLGELQVFFQLLAPAKAAPRSGALVLDGGVAAGVGVSFFAQVAFVVLAVLLWSEQADRQVFVEQRRDPDILAQVVARQDEAPVVLEADDADAQVASRAGEEEGRFGDSEAPVEEAPKVPRLDAPRADHAPDEAGLVGLLSTNKPGGSGAIGELLGEASEGVSNELAVAMNGDGDVFVRGHGAGGMGFQGIGPGGGDDGTGRIEGLGTIDTGPGPGIRASLPDRRPRRRVGTVDLGKGVAKGFCRTDRIASVVRRRAGAIRACYEQRLQVKRGLKGKLTTRWTIGLDGKVFGVSANTDTLGDAKTRRCIFRALERLRFDKPEGGVCVVQWPFVFSPG